MITNLDEIKNALPLWQVIEKFIPLRKSGTTYFACCPFHGEKSGSLAVPINKQFWKCFGCDEKGDAISFIMKYKRLEFDDAVEVLSDLVGVPIQNSRNHELRKTNNQACQQALVKAHELMKQLLFKKENFNGAARLYFRQRGIDNTAMQALELCYMETFKDEFDKNLTSEDMFFLQQVGLFRTYEGRLYSPFRNRVGFPIRDVNGVLCGFSFREIIKSKDPNKQAPKYMNTPESGIFKKAQLLYYPMKSTLEDMHRQKRVVICEGFFDAIFANRYLPAVAVCGATFGEGHVSFIRRIDKDASIYLCFDNDKAGVEATARAVKLLVSIGIDDGVVLVLKDKSMKDMGEMLVKPDRPSNTDGFFGMFYQFKFYEFISRYLYKYQKSQLKKCMDEFADINFDFYEKLCADVSDLTKAPISIKDRHEEALDDIPPNIIMLLWNMQDDGKLFIAKSQLQPIVLGKYSELYKNMLDGDVPLCVLKAQNVPKLSDDDFAILCNEIKADHYMRLKKRMIKNGDIRALNMSN